MRFYAMVKSKNGIPTNGKLLLNIRTEKKLPLQLGNILEIKTVILPLDEPKNPGEFHYKNYLKTQGVYAKLSFVPPKKIMSISSDSSWILKIKARAVQKIVESSFSTESKGLILAMLFGGRNTIPREKMNEFRDAGILHILAISGLHVGLLLLVFQFLFSPLKRIGKHSAFYHLLVLGCLWIYAFGVGASPSVIRAVTMFSVFSVGALSKRKRPNIVLVIADGSSPNYIKRKWANTCKEYGIPFHDTAEKGAIEISPENEEQSFVYNFRNLLRH